MWDFLVSHIDCFDESMYTGVFLISLTDCFGGVGVFLFGVFLVCFCFFFLNCHVYWRCRYKQPLCSWFIAFLIERMLVGNLNTASPLIGCVHKEYIRPLE